MGKKRFKYYSNNPERCFRKQNTKYIFTIVVFSKYGCESWTIKKADPQGINAFELWYWRRLLRVPGTSWSSNQSNLKEINPEYSLEGLMMKLKLQNFGHLFRSTDSLEKTLMLGKIENRRKGQRGWDDWKASPTQWTWVWASWGDLWRIGKPCTLHSMGSQRVGHNWVTEQQQFCKWNPDIWLTVYVQLWLIFF